MESLTRIVSESLSRHGVETFLDPRRLQWSPWFRCQSNASTFHVPGKPGLLALAEELAVFCGASEPRSRHPEGSEGSPAGVQGMNGKRMLALFQISETDDLGMALGLLFLPGNPEADRLSNGRCFARYAVIDDAYQRHSACRVFQQWMLSWAETASGGAQEFGFVSGHDFSRAAIGPTSTAALAAATAEPPNAWERLESSNEQAQIGPPALPSGF
jgi:hypothetical protein